MVQGTIGVKGWNLAEASERSLERFFTLVSFSLGVAPGVFLDTEQLAETFNGLIYADLQEGIEFWKCKIPVALANGYGVYNDLPLPRVGSSVIVETDKAIERVKGRSRRWSVLDVLITTPYRSIIIDWKCHSIQNEDIGQIRYYLEHLSRVRNRRESNLTGWAVDVLTGECMEIKHRPLRVDASSRPGDHP